MKNLNQVYSHVKAGNGATYSLNFGALEAGREVYCISTQGNERRVGLEEFNLQMLIKYTKDHADLLADERNYLGIWITGTDVVMDITDIWEQSEWDEDFAREIGRLRGQTAIWDNKLCIEVMCYDVDVHTHKGNVIHWELMTDAAKEGLADMEPVNDKIGFIEQTKFEAMEFFLMKKRHLYPRFIESVPSWAAADRVDVIIDSISGAQAYNILMVNGQPDLDKLSQHAYTHGGSYYYRDENVFCREKLQVSILEKALKFISRNAK